ncbi:MAG: sterol desaturase family protein, partial [Oceanicaulis sp.]
WHGIYRDVRSSKSPRDALGYVFGPPGWSPDGSRDSSKILKQRWAAKRAGEAAPAAPRTPAEPERVPAE